MSSIIEENRIEDLFRNKRKGVLSVYFTAGYPQQGDTRLIMRSLQKAGADMIEVGMPFSDPVADGPTIQESNRLALQNGMSIALLFDQLEGFRQEIDIPVILMGYINPVLQYGLERFCRKCAETGVDGLILPDLPMREYIEEYRPVFERYGLFNIFLITPQTSEQRVREIDTNSRGFIYMVSTSSTTGARQGISKEQISYFKRIREMELHNPLMIGFGISDSLTFNLACTYANGAIIGSAFIKSLATSGSLNEGIESFIKEIKGV